MDKLSDGVQKFRKEAFPRRRELFHTLAHTQSPDTLFIACSDSRVVPELLTQREPGELFVIRNAGNIVPPSGPQPGGVSATVEYAISVLGVREVVICGHSDCGAMTAVAHEHDLSQLPAVANWLHHADAAKLVNSARAHTSAEASLDGLVHENVVAQIANLRTHPSVALALAQNRLNLHGWVFDIETGQVDALDGTTGRFVPLADHPGATAFGSAPSVRVLAGEHAEAPPVLTKGSPMLQTQISQSARQHLAETAVANKAARGLSWKAVAEGTGMNVAFITAAVLGQHPLPKAAAKIVGERLGFDADQVLLLESVPMRGSMPDGVPIDPTIYRLYEIIQVYGPTLKSLIHEEFGDGILSAINFRLNIEKVEDPEGGHRAIITLNSKYLPVKPF